MSIDRIKEISKDSIIPISMGLMLALVAGVWTLAAKVSEWEQRLILIEAKVSARWTFFMERDSWKDFKYNNPDLNIPDVDDIRDVYKLK